MRGFQNRPGMVSKWWTRPTLLFFAQSRHQSKIYTESNQSGFSRIFGDLTSMQTLAIYRRLLVKDRLRDQPQRLRSIATEPKETVGVA
jgi:hypothetical protein